MKRYHSVPTMIGLLSATAMLGACSFSKPHSAHHASGWSSGGSYSTGYSGSVQASTPTTRTYYAPRISSGYTGPATTISASAPYGSATNHYGGGSGVKSRLRPAGYSYGSLGATMYDVDGEAFGIQGRLGYQFSPLLGAEAEASIGVIDDEETTGGTTVETGTDYQVAAFGLAKLPIGNRLSVHARGGYHQTEITSDSTTGGVTTTTEFDDDGFAYGAGASYALSNRDSLRLDYTNYEINGGNLDSVSLAYQRRF